MEKIQGLKLNLTINPIFEKNFRYLMSQVDNTEWGGIVVYDMKNSFFDKEIDIELLDFILLDIGSVAETQHTYAENPEATTLFMKYIGKPYGLIHSHTGQVYYSSTDTMEIIERQKYYPDGYLSVVTNSRGDILARLNQYFETTITTTINLGGQQKISTTKHRDIHYTETEIYINDETDFINERMEIIAKRKEEEKTKEKKNKKNSKSKVYNSFTDDDEIYGYGSESRAIINY